MGALCMFPKNMGRWGIIYSGHPSPFRIEKVGMRNRGFILGGEELIGSHFVILFTKCVALVCLSFILGHNLPPSPLGLIIVIRKTFFSGNCETFRES